MQRARQERAAVADPRPGQAAPGGERRCGGSRPGFAVGERRDSAWEGEALGTGPGVLCSELRAAAAESPPG